MRVTINQIRDRIETVFDYSEKGRAGTIARTEAMSSHNAAKNETAKQTGATANMWLSSRDPKVRESHAAADGQRVKIGDLFNVGGEELEYPGDPSGSPENVINCRCIATYLSDE